VWFANAPNVGVNRDSGA